MSTDQYKNLVNELERLVNDMKGDFAELDFVPDTEASAQWITKTSEPFHDSTDDTGAILGIIASKALITRWSTEEDIRVREECGNAVYMQVAYLQDMLDGQHVTYIPSASKGSTQDKTVLALLLEDPVSLNGEPTFTKANGGETTVQGGHDSGLQKQDAVNQMSASINTTSEGPSSLEVSREHNASREVPYNDSNDIWVWIGSELASRATHALVNDQLTNTPAQHNEASVSGTCHQSSDVGRAGEAIPLVDSHQRDGNSSDHEVENNNSNQYDYIESDDESSDDGVISLTSPNDSGADN
ncbi:MAG: hypothetical protein TREMPRED_001811 [Tremellales sp. Tagirdzhanova-0007]|nr:MAG: hypothetical protein TREMPRED_001811 [Tremellales sp. Tagirdzhanova-0007]